MLFARLKDLFSTLRFRLMMWVTIVVLVMVVVTMVTVRAVVDRTLMLRFGEEVTGEADRVAAAVQEDYPSNKNRLIGKLQEQVKALSGREYIREWFVELYTSDGTLYWATSNIPLKLAPPVLDGPAADQIEVKSYRIVERRLVGQGAQELLVRCGCSRRPVEEDLELVDRIMFWSGLVTLLLAPIGGYALAGRATRPIAKIIATAANLQPSKLDERLPIRGTGDELDQLSRTINGMLDRIASYIERNRDFVANAAHELRSPLAAIRSTVEVALNRARTPDEYASLLTDVMEECTQLAGLVNLLLLLAEGDAGQIGARDQSVRLDKVVHEAADMFEGVAEAQGVSLIVGEIPPMVVPGGEHHVRQVVRNLIDNAIKFTPAPGEIHVSLGVQREQRRAWLQVRDSGIGIAADDLPRIFERFYRADKARSRESRRGGHGLGLSICQSIVTALGGEIAVDSRPGRGSTFNVWLPLLGEGQTAPGAEAVTPGV
jgi:signal transduction histidine kinase